MAFLFAFVCFLFISGKENGVFGMDRQIQSLQINPHGSVGVRASIQAFLSALNGCSGIKSKTVKISCTHKLDKMTQGIDCTKKVPAGTKATFTCPNNTYMVEKYDSVTCGVPTKKKWSGKIVKCRSSALTSTTVLTTTLETTVTTEMTVSEETTATEDTTSIADTDTPSAINPNPAESTAMSTLSSVVPTTTTSGATTPSVANTTTTASVIPVANSSPTTAVVTNTPTTSTSTNTITTTLAPTNTANAAGNSAAATTAPTISTTNVAPASTTTTETLAVITSALAAPITTTSMAASMTTTSMTAPITMSFPAETTAVSSSVAVTVVAAPTTAATTIAAHTTAAPTTKIVTEATTTTSKLSAYTQVIDVGLVKKSVVPKIYLDAKTECEQDGATLFVMNSMKKCEYIEAFGNIANFVSATGVADIWVGVAWNNGWKTPQGVIATDPFVYKWTPGRPVAGNRCAVYSRPGKTLWDSLNCFANSTIKNPFLCEIV